MDKNLISLDTPLLHSGKLFNYGSLLDGSGNTDTLKITGGVSSVDVTGGKIVGGSEDCVDINNLAKHINVNFAEWQPTGRFLSTIKGGAKGITLSGHVISHGNEVDIDLGNSSEQSSEKVREVRLYLISKKGPITIRCLWSDLPFLPKGFGPFKYVFPWPWLGPLRLIIAKLILWTLAIVRSVRKKL